MILKKCRIKMLYTGTHTYIMVLYSVVHHILITALWYHNISVHDFNETILFLNIYGKFLNNWQICIHPHVCILSIRAETPHRMIQSNNWCGMLGYRIVFKHYNLAFLVRWTVHIKWTHSHKVNRSEALGQKVTTESNIFWL